MSERRSTGRPFVKGRSGNPGGRPKNPRITAHAGLVDAAAIIAADAEQSDADKVQALLGLCRASFALLRRWVNSKPRAVDAGGRPEKTCTEPEQVSARAVDAGAAVVPPDTGTGAKPVGPGGEREDGKLQATCGSPDPQLDSKPADLSDLGTRAEPNSTDEEPPEVIDTAAPNPHEIDPSREPDEG